MKTRQNIISLETENKFLPDGGHSVFLPTDGSKEIILSAVKFVATRSRSKMNCFRVNFLIAIIIIAYFV